MSDRDAEPAAGLHTERELEEQIERSLTKRLKTLRDGLEAANAKLGKGDGDREAAITALRYVIEFFSPDPDYGPLMQPLENLGFALLDVSGGHKHAMFARPKKDGARPKTQVQQAVKVWALVAVEAVRPWRDSVMGKIGAGPDSHDGVYAFVQKEFARSGVEVGYAQLRKWYSSVKTGKDPKTQRRVSARIDAFQKIGQWPTDASSAKDLIRKIVTIATLVK